ncbi:MAG: hypothetical protein AAF652_03990 [Cyanobacteria bacterium P01_C01_bin.72]
MSPQQQQTGRLARIWRSFFNLPTWVQIWMMLILGPVNLATLTFLDQPAGTLIAALALSGMIITVGIVLAVGKFSKLAAAGHILPWTPLMWILIFARPEGSPIYQIFLTTLLVINAISLAFDFNDLRILLKSRAKN